jgi:hypothetical protein
VATALEAADSKRLLKVRVIPGSDGYAAFVAALRLANDPSRYRVGANFLRGALFGTPGATPAATLLGLLAGHFSPIIAFLEREDLVLVFDVNHKFGAFLVPTRRYVQRERLSYLFSLFSSLLIFSLSLWLPFDFHSLFFTFA